MQRRSGPPIHRNAFTLAELLVVIGILAMLTALLLPSLQLARKQAMSATCGVQLQNVGTALEGFRSEFEYYPLWDDGGSPIRYTWIDVLIQQRYLTTHKTGYCPTDPLPAPFNETRAQETESDLIYPLDPTRRGVDYSFGISVPLSAGAWNWRPNAAGTDLGTGNRRFVDYDRFTSRRILAADANWTKVYNLSGVPYGSTVWNDPTQYDNMVDYRHPRATANLLFQDGHVARVRYEVASQRPVDTIAQFVWYPGEPIDVDPTDHRGDQAYPAEPPPHPFTDPPGDVLPREVLPHYYTAQRGWTEIRHK